jgi:hypothetical protein
VDALLNTPDFNSRCYQPVAAGSIHICYQIDVRMFRVNFACLHRSCAFNCDNIPRFFPNANSSWHFALSVKRRRRLCPSLSSPFVLLRMVLLDHRITSCPMYTHLGESVQHFLNETIWIKFH